MRLYDAGGSDRWGASADAPSAGAETGLAVAAEGARSRAGSAPGPGVGEGEGGLAGGGVAPGAANSAARVTIASSEDPLSPALFWAVTT